MSEAVQVTGLREIRSDLRKIGDTERLRELRDGLKEAASVVADEAQRRVPVVSGKARKSIRSLVSGNSAFVAGGKKTVPYYGWLDFGTRTPRSGQPRSSGPWTGTGSGPAEGRFIYPAIEAKKEEVVRLVDQAMGRALKRKGF